MNRREFLKQCGYCVLAYSGWNLIPDDCSARNLSRGFIRPKLSPYFVSLENKQIRCTLCPHECMVGDKDRGLCRVRENRGGQYYSLTYGNPCSVHIDPIEKKPFFHVLPDTHSFSIATAGCNFTCKFCQNWEISQTQPDETYNYELSPEDVVKYALNSRCRSIASTYVEPAIFTEYMLDIGRAARKQGLLKVMHSNGYINEAPLKDLCRNLDAACIDLKAFTEEYYRDISGGTLKPVLNTLKVLKAQKIHTEIVNLVVPTKNDNPEQIRSMCRWIKTELGAETPLHFSRFYPIYKLTGLPPTPVSTLENARKIALEQGLFFVYIGNVPGHEAEHTFCPECKKAIIERRGYQIVSQHLKDGQCEYCHHKIPGIWN